eukprot:TRINITY_DN11788_c0_g1_i1.p1 TRINITY_DN11788_c0_g1~~TRINITY_DN11788_c0_g1_i1.p1  ORF type:complete len:518 (+),score=97.80 TRINITY_DN11788_c0_g1_i1:117-1670(+)
MALFASAETSSGRPVLASRCQKTILCKFYEEGACQRGANCKFAHGSEEMRPQPNFQCTKMCQSVYLKVVCQDAQCRFAHSADELRLSQEQRSADLMSKQVMEMHGNSSTLTDQEVETTLLLRASQRHKTVPAKLQHAETTAKVKALTPGLVTERQKNSSNNNNSSNISNSSNSNSLTKKTCPQVESAKIPVTKVAATVGAVVQSQSSQAEDNDSNNRRRRRGGRRGHNKFPTLQLEHQGEGEMNSGFQPEENNTKQQESSDVQALKDEVQALNQTILELTQQVSNLALASTRGEDSDQSETGVKTAQMSGPFGFQQRLDAFNSSSCLQNNSTAAPLLCNNSNSSSWSSLQSLQHQPQMFSRSPTGTSTASSENGLERRIQNEACGSGSYFNTQSTTDFDFGVAKFERDFSIGSGPCFSRQSTTDTDFRTKFDRLPSCDSDWEPRFERLVSLPILDELPTSSEPEPVSGHALPLEQSEQWPVLIVKNTFLDIDEDRAPFEVRARAKSTPKRRATPVMF